jgi:hypothetical protein
MVGVLAAAVLAVLAACDHSEIGAVVLGKPEVELIARGIARTDPRLTRLAHRKKFTLRISLLESWQEWQGSNLRPPVLETGALPIELHSYRDPASPPIRAVSSIGDAPIARAKRG